MNPCQQLLTTTIKLQNRPASENRLPSRLQKEATLVLSWISLRLLDRECCECCLSERWWSSFNLPQIQRFILQSSGESKQYLKYFCVSMYFFIWHKREWRLNFRLSFPIPILREKKKRFLTSCSWFFIWSAACLARAALATSAARRSFSRRSASSFARFRSWSSSRALRVCSSSSAKRKVCRQVITT